jgi:hypothetical protein
MHSQLPMNSSHTFLTLYTSRAVGGTVELTTTDMDLWPDAVNKRTGMSPERAKEWGRAWVDVMLHVLPDLKKYRGIK